ncbi:Vam6/Vps39-like protein [Vanrija pseudolonga]|uniref:Vam6/Vps39-like protein n=1 Tax=Vanrija pseudolonga TaxID=143232 RepID=A0AAF0Y9U8_9TREE|nr:Vam6/Vps39-like protein [Vanrija pseudolonga]
MGSLSLSPLLQATKARITALHQHETTLYAGCADGTLRVYDLGAAEPVLSGTHTLGKKAIEQIAVLSEAGQLAVLIDTVVTLIKLDKLDNPTAKGNSTVLTGARYAHAFAATTYFEARDGAKAARDILVVGCWKKVVVYGAGKNLGELWELSLPHSPRRVIFPAPVYADIPGAVHLLYTPSSSVILSIRAGVPPAERLTVTELPSTGYPPVAGKTAAPSLPASTSSYGLSGLGGLLGKSAPVPVGTRTVGGEVLLIRDDAGVFFSSEGNFTREQSLHWPATPDGIAFANPYIYSVVPPVSVNAHSVPLPSIHVHLAPTLAHRQTLTFPSPSAGVLNITCPTVGLSTATGEGKPLPRLLLVSTPTDRALLAAEGSTIWQLPAPNIGEQVDDLVRDGRVVDAIGLVEAVGDAGLEPSQRLPHLRILQGLIQFAHGDYKSAMEAFVVHNVHPAKVVALFPKDTISGNLAVPRKQWMSLFGAVDGARIDPPPATSEEPAKPAFKPHLSLLRKGSNETLRSVASGVKEEAAPTSPTLKEETSSSEVTLPRKAIDELIYYLSDRRQKLAGAIPALGQPLPSEGDLTPLSSLHAAEVHSLPNGPLTDLSPIDLLRTAQVVYTSLLKVYLVARPSLVGSLCRIENWCDVAEVEPLLRQKMRFDDLRDLYMQKQMHDKAIAMLSEQAKDEDDPLDRYPPTIRYLQKLGPKHLQLIFDSSKWIFKEDPKRALQIFTADEPEVDALPRTDIVAFLEKENAESAVTYLEHLVELGDTNPDFHDKLAELYLSRARQVDDHEKKYHHFLDFLNSSSHYRAYRLLSKLKPEEMPEARAILLGRMGNHDEALQIYAYKLKDYAAAEAYCARVYAKKPDPRGIFLHLLKLYLRPKPPQDVLIQPALSLVGRHGTRIDAREVLDLLPPLVPVKDLHDFFLRTLGESRTRRNEHRIMRGLLQARKQQVERLVVGLEVKRVRVTDQRTCPQCQKRLGQSAIAVHAPRGEVTHLHCKDQFSAKLAKLRE